MSLDHNLRLVLVFSMTFSLVALSGSISNNLHLPTVQLAHGIPEPCQTHGSGGACSQFWYPAGPEMDTLRAVVYTDSTMELNDLAAVSPGIDFPDTPFTPKSCLTCLNNLVSTAPIGQNGYYEIQFMLASNFWGCSFDFGSSTCGVEIRQGIAHMIDKTSFTKTDPSAGTSTPIDNPVPTTSGGGLTSPDPCGYDNSFQQSGTNCVVGAAGGTSYHLANAGGANGVPWLQAPGSVDLNAAAQHFVNAGLATGFNQATSVLTGVSSAAASRPINFFVRNDDPARLHLGDGLAEQICYIFTGSYTVPCAYLTVTHGPISAYPGFTTSTTSINLSWSMYTALYSPVPFFDNSLYFTYNSRFVSGIPSIQPPNGPCSAEALPTDSAPDYVYLCSPAYDSLSSQMEFAPCLSAVGDPTPGQNSNGPGADCPNTTKLSAISAGVHAEANFGANVFTLPIFERSVQFAYPNTGWVRAINDNDVGLPNYFTWLNAWNPAPPVPDTIRQGFSQTTSSVSPFVDSTIWDQYIVGNIYDSLTAANPLSSGQLIDWMTLSISQLTNPSLTYTPPQGTVASFRFTLRSDMFFQDSSKVTAFDAAFSYLALSSTGAFAGEGAVPMTGITILGPLQFDINVKAVGPFTLLTLTSLPIMPGAYWSSTGSSTWKSQISTCTATGAQCYPAQYTLTPPPATSPTCALKCVFAASTMNVNSLQTSATYDPIIAGTLIGSGGWMCGTGPTVGTGCSSSGAMNPPPGGSYTLTRFGKGQAPGSSINSIYFRSSGSLALWIWSQDTGDITHDFLNFGVVAECFGAPLTMAAPCAHFQQGIGGDICTIGNSCSAQRVGLTQVSIVNRFVGVNWVAPFDWAASPPVGISPPVPVLYEDTIVLNPSSVVGCSAPFPTGGYDC